MLQHRLNDDDWSGLNTLEPCYQAQLLVDWLDTLSVRLIHLVGQLPCVTRLSISLSIYRFFRSIDHQDPVISTKLSTHMLSAPDQLDAQYFRSTPVEHMATLRRTVDLLLLVLLALELLSAMLCVYLLSFVFLSTSLLSAMYQHVCPFVVVARPLA